MATTNKISFLTVFLFLFNMNIQCLAEESVSVKDITPAEDSTTTVQIKKGKAATTCEKLWEVQDGTSEINGEAAAITKAARANWTDACNAWKKEFRNDNKDNKIISLSCGTPNCKSESGGNSCASEGKFKIKTKMN